jgi:hypothetical protein
LWVFACYHSLNLAVATRIVESLLVVLLYWPHIERITGSRRNDLLRIYLRSTLLTVTAVAPAAALMMVYGWSPHVPLLQVALSICVGIAAYGGALFLLDHTVMIEIAGLIRVWRKRRLGA